MNHLTKYDSLEMKDVRSLLVNKVELLKQMIGSYQDAFSVGEYDGDELEILCIEVLDLAIRLNIEGKNNGQPR